MKTTKTIIGFRPGHLAPLVDKWLSLNPGKTTSDLIRIGLFRELRPLAGKEFKHIFKS